MTRAANTLKPKRQFADISSETAVALEILQARRAEHSDILVAGMDEVGRGALAGPVTVGVSVVKFTLDNGIPRLPGDRQLPELQDSKKLSLKQRLSLISTIHAWAEKATVGHASPEEIEIFGLSSALSLAARRAWHNLASGLAQQVDALILDGRDNWLDRAPEHLVSDLEAWPQHVRLQVKADSQCASVAAAAIVAKVTRDNLLAELDKDHPEYGWASNKGYGSTAHRQALEEYGLTPHHRRSWCIKKSVSEQGTLL